MAKIVNDFKVTRDRDAWATIRGFIYQAELSLDRWLDISGDTVLELERGEDIDTLAGIVQEHKLPRLLEQIKLRESRVTLNVAAPALASFYEHWSTNRQRGLVFRYVTNAEVAIERPSVFPKREAGISAWERLRSGKVEPVESESLLKAIRMTLKKATRPTDTNEKTWAAFQTFLDTSCTDQLLQFTSVVEWSVHHATPESLQQHLETRLLSEGYSHTPKGATDLYQRLLLFVLKLLSKRGLKQLTAADKQAIILQGSLSDEDHVMLKTLQMTADTIQSRVSDIEKVLGILEQEMDKVVTHGTHDFVSYGTSPVLILDVPPRVEKLVTRKYRISRYEERLTAKTWCAIYGDLGSGKTHLAIEMANSDWNKVLWLRFRDKDAAASSQYLYSVFSQIGTISSYKWGTVVTAAVSRFPDSSLIVLDDLPRTDESDVLNDQLVTLTTACSQTGTKIFSTSPHRLANSVRQALGSKVLEEEVPTFSDNEVVELLNVHGAPTSMLTKKFASGLGTLTRSHPTLLTAAIQYMVAREWIWDSAALADLLSGAYAWREKERTRQLLVATVREPSTRDLLYRLTLTYSTFGKRDLWAVARAEPAISYPLEKLSSVTGLWVQQDSTDNFSLSPLLGQLGSEDLSEETKRQAHLELGKTVLELKVLGPLEVSRAVAHFSSAHEYNTAGQILTRCLRAFLDSDITDDYGVSGYWYDSPLPPEMTTEVRLYLRASQAQVRARLGKDFEKAIDDIELIVRSEPIEGFAVVSTIVILISSSVRDKLPFERVASLLKTLITAWPAVNDMPEELSDFRPEWLVWVLGSKIESHTDLKEWLDVLTDIAPAKLQSTFESPMGFAGVVAISESLWTAEHQKSDAARNWPLVLGAYELACAKAEELKLDLLFACLVRAIITVKAEYLKDLTSATQVAEKTLSTFHNPHGHFLIKECIGRQFYYASDNSKAIEWLTEAAQYSGDHFPYLLIRCLLLVSQVVGDQDPALAAHYSGEGAETALQFGRTQPPIDELADGNVRDFDDLFVPKVLAEHAISLWLNHRLADAFKAIEIAFQLLWDVKSDDHGWKALFVVLGHVNGYLSSIASTGDAPGSTWEREDYAAPFRGIMFQYSPQAALEYHPERDYLVTVQLATFSSAVGNDERAVAWSWAALERLRKTGNSTPLPIISDQIIGQLIKVNQFSDAIDIGLQTGAVLLATKKSRSLGTNPLITGLDVDEYLGPKPNSQWSDAERFGAKLALFPIMIELLRRDITDSTDARTQADRVSATCQLVREVSSDPILWERYAELFRWFFHDRPRATALREKARILNKEVGVELQVLCYLAVSIASTPVEAMASQLAVLPYLSTLLGRIGYLERNILIPFLQEYWVRTFKVKRVYFRTPALVDRAIEAAINHPLETRGKKILSAVLLGLNVKESDDVKKWLRN